MHGSTERDEHGNRAGVCSPIDVGVGLPDLSTLPQLVVEGGSSPLLSYVAVWREPAISMQGGNLAVRKNETLTLLSHVGVGFSKGSANRDFLKEVQSGSTEVDVTGVVASEEGSLGFGNSGSGRIEEVSNSGQRVIQPFPLDSNECPQQLLFHSKNCKVKERPSGRHIWQCSRTVLLSAFSGRGVCFTLNFPLSAPRVKRVSARSKTSRRKREGSWSSFILYTFSGTVDQT
ncbi:hypothetical protein NE237_006985 [Protea cynaroides]|uniref:Uncharacterized protein n=1 Tax=Protea cynaroides TaxID=273540 RepID=A0A9Q0KNK0_9MAGN|nr:hypothetical protein NE237_006985 [Protea cynaroides]